MKDWLRIRSQASRSPAVVRISTSSNSGYGRSDLFQARRLHPRQCGCGLSLRRAGLWCEERDRPRSELGLRTDKSFAVQAAILTLRGRVAWAHDFNPNRGIGATFQTLPGASSFVNGAAQASDFALVTASAETRSCEWLVRWWCDMRGSQLTSACG